MDEEPTYFKKIENIFGEYYYDNRKFNTLKECKEYFDYHNFIKNYSNNFDKDYPNLIEAKPYSPTPTTNKTPVVGIVPAKAPVQAQESILAEAECEVTLS